MTRTRSLTIPTLTGATALIRNPVTFIDPTGHSVLALAGFGFELGSVGLATLGIGLAVVAVGVGVVLLVDYLVNSPSDNYSDSSTIHSNVSETIKDNTGNKDIATKPRSSERIADRNNYPTRKKAKEAAKQAGKGNEPILHPDHGNGNGNGPHDHYYFPKRQF